MRNERPQRVFVGTLITDIFYKEFVVPHLHAAKGNPYPYNLYHV